MSGYQDLQLVQAGLCLAALLVLCSYTIMVREDERPPIVWFGVIVAGIASLTFGAVFLITHEHLGAERRLEMMTRLLREVPAVFIVGYACLVQVRRYRGARNRRLLRKWFERAPILLSGALFSASVLGTLAPYPILHLLEPLPLRALLVDVVWMIPLGGFSALSAFVFFEAIGQEMPGFRQRIQNLSAALGMACISVIVWNALLTTGVRVLGAPAWLSWNARTVADLQVVLVGAAAAGFAVAVVSYQARDRRTDVTERFLRFVEVVGEVSEVVENAPISKMGLSVEYASLLEAGGREVLDLSMTDMRKLDDAFRISIIWASGRPPGMVTRLLHLARVYDEELGSIPDGTSTGSSGPPGMYGVLKLALSVAEGTEGWGTKGDLRDAPIWAQLCSVALADAAMLGPDQRKAVMEGDVVADKVRDAYMLAKWKVNTVRFGSGLPAAPGRQPGRRT